MVLAEFLIWNCSNSSLPEVVPAPSRLSSFCCVTPLYLPHLLQPLSICFHHLFLFHAPPVLCHVNLDISSFFSVLSVTLLCCRLSPPFFFAICQVLVCRLTWATLTGVGSLHFGGGAVRPTVGAWRFCSKGTSSTLQFPCGPPVRSQWPSYGCASARGISWPNARGIGLDSKQSHSIPVVMSNCFQAVDPQLRYTHMYGLPAKFCHNS